jgi:hypothetical protein
MHLERRRQRKAVANGPVPEGLSIPFPMQASPPTPNVIEAVLERIVAEAEALPRACLWCVASLENGAAFCGDECEATWRSKLMPAPFARSVDGSTIPSFERLVKRSASARWGASSAPTKVLIGPNQAAGEQKGPPHRSGPVPGRRAQQCSSAAVRTPHNVDPLEVGETAG